MVPLAMAGKRVIPAEHRPAARLTRPLREFLSVEASGGIVLLIAVVIAMVWANSPWSESYETFWHTYAGFEFGSFKVEHDLRHWVNDALMVLFFFVIGLEVKRELVVGDLSTLRAAILPSVAAVGGMVVPAAIYLSLNLGGAAEGWGVPVATDIAFAIGVLALLGSRVPPNLRILLLTLAIVDDIGAILIIAVFYSSGLDLMNLLLGGIGIAAIALLRVLHVWWVPAYVLVGTAVWFFIFESGIHATIAGVIVGLITPARPLEDPAKHLERARPFGLEPAAASLDRALTAASVPVTDRLAHALHPWTSYLILPLFALANAGIDLRGTDLGAAVSSPIVLGIVLGLVVGKTLGVTAFAWLARKLGGALPPGVSMRHITGMAALAGIGFTMSLFIATLAFDDASRIEEAKLAILMASVVAAVVGAGLLVTGRTEPAEDGDGPQEAGTLAR